MLKLFRKIRQKLLSENKFSKYLLYAVGEIVLVVIGILIALQINNWNDEKKDRALEIKILKEIHSNLEHDLNEIQHDISVMDSVDLASKNVIHFLKTQDKPTEAFYDDVAKIKVAPHFDPNKSGYELLVSKGVEIVLKDSLRAAISVLYESAYSYYGKYEEERIKFKAEQIHPVLLRYFTAATKPDSVWKSSFFINLEDYGLMKNEGVFFKLVNAVNFENHMVYDRASVTERHIYGLKGLIEEELQSKEVNY
ncbi:DUF6090 family protein [Flavisericum labens]|uniref:DUF6090 family protein n=1 Tax=Flavisericum labens TaxID=3377112 RepID=UPI00387AE170